MATLEITAALAQAGARAIVLSEGGRMTEAVQEAGGEWVPFPAATRNPVRIFGNVGHLTRFLAENGADLIHARSRAPAWSAIAAARRTRIPIVTTYHGAYSGGSRLKNTYNAVMAQGDRVIANSRYTADLIRRRHGTGENRLRIIHRGVDLKTFDAAKVRAGRVAKLKQSWGVKEGDKIVLHAARLTGWKGHRVVIEAAQQLRGQGGLERVAIILAGDAQGREDYRRELEAQIAAGGLEGVVRLAGHCDDMPAAFAAAHVALVASTEPEAFGRAAIEAQAMGCPVIAAELGAVPETVLAPPAVKPGAATGWLVAPGEPIQLADALAGCLGLSASKRREIGRRARAHVAESFSLEAMRSGTLEVYRELLGDRLGASRPAGARAKKSG